MTARQRTSARRSFRSAIGVLLLAVGGVALAPSPAWAEPEPIETMLSVIADGHSENGIVLHAVLTGPYVQSGGYIPAGAWTFVVVDGAGAQVFGAEIDRVAGGPTEADAVWPDAPAGLAASAIVTYTASEAADQFSFAGATAEITSDGSREPATHAQVGEPDDETLLAESAPSRTADPLPVGVSITIAVVLLGAGVLALVLIRRRRASPTTPGS
jgi:hypothetical protein